MRTQSKGGPARGTGLWAHVQRSINKSIGLHKIAEYLIMRGVPQLDAVAEYTPDMEV